MPKYLVYFEQVNASVYVVDAESEDEAVDRAAHDWTRDNTGPELKSVEELD